MLMTKALAASAAVRTAHERRHLLGKGRRWAWRFAAKLSSRRE
jgi:hypothetical protein